MSRNGQKDTEEAGCREFTRDVLVDYLKCALPDQSARLLADHVENCPDCAQALADLEKLLALIGEHETAREVPPVANLNELVWAHIARKARPRSAVWHTWSTRILAAAASVLLITGLFFGLQKRAPRKLQGHTPLVTATVSKCAGQVFFTADRVTAPLTAGITLRAGTVLETVGASSSVCLEFADTTVAALAGNSKLTVGAGAAGRGDSTLQLSAGKIALEVAKQDRLFVVGTPTAVATVLGTRFTLAVTENATRLEVEAGRVQFERLLDGSVVVVSAGHWATSLAGVELVAREVMTEGQSAPESLTTGLLAHWPFDEGKGNTVADTSGNGNDGVFMGRPEWTAGCIGGAVELVGDSYIQLPKPVAGDRAAFTISGWLRTSESRRMDVYSELNSASYKDGNINLNVNEPHPGNVCFVRRTGGKDGRISRVLVQDGLNDGNWHHIVAVRAGATLSLHVDGVFSGTVPAGSGTVVVQVALIGLLRNAETYNGEIDDLRIYDRVLTAAERDALFKMGAGRSALRTADRP